MKMILPMRKFTRAALLVSMGFLLLALATGCSSEKGGGKDRVVTKAIKQMAAPAAPKPGSAETQKDSGKDANGPLAVASVETRPPYNPEGKIDPFAPLFRQEVQPVVAHAVQKDVKPDRPRTPLERLDLGQLKLVAVVATADERKGLVEEASGKGYVVELGTSIGRERGKIVEIMKDKIVIQQNYEDDFGDNVVKHKELKLQKPPGE